MIGKLYSFVCAAKESTHTQQPSAWRDLIYNFPMTRVRIFTYINLYLYFILSQENLTSCYIKPLSIFLHQIQFRFKITSGHPVC